MPKSHWWSGAAAYLEIYRVASLSSPRLRFQVGTVTLLCFPLPPLHTSELLHLSHTYLLLQGLPLAAVTAALSLPGFLVKQIINCFQLRSSMQVGTGRAWNSGPCLLPGLNVPIVCIHAC